MNINNNDRWWKPRNYNPFTPRNYGPSGHANWEPYRVPNSDWKQYKLPGWDTTSWENLTKSISENPAPLNEQWYFFDGKTFSSYKEFQEYSIKKQKEKDIRARKQEAILERLKDPLENNVDEEVVCCKCSKSLEIFAIPYQLIDNGNTYQGHIFIEYCARCESFVERCHQGREAYLAIAKAELAANKKSN